MSKTSNSADKFSQASPKEKIIPITVAPNSTKGIITRSQNKKQEVKEVPTTIISSSEEMDTTFEWSDVSMSQDSECTSPDTELMLERPIPPMLVPEKIIIILDQSLDDNFTHFEQVCGKKYTPLCMLQHAIQIFLNNKHIINDEHEFALITLNENSATWVHDFTNSPQDIIASLSTIKPCTNEDIFNLNSVFDVINKNVCLPKLEGIATPYVVRAILLYDRSYSIPTLKESPEIVSLLNSPLFILDVIMTHEPPSVANHCEKINEILQKLDTKGLSYSFSVSRNSKDLHIAMGKLLGHSLQRPPQTLLNYDITKFKL